MIAPQKVQVLERLLSGLPAPVAQRLAKAVEVDRLSGGRALPHEVILDSLRPSLRGAEGSRVASPRRLFCRPFEDLFISGPRRSKVQGEISRESIIPVWNWLEQTLLPEATAAYMRDCQAALVSLDAEGALARAGEFWLASAAAMSTAVLDKAGRAHAKARLGSEATLADAEEMARLLAIGPEVIELQKLIPRPLPSLSEPILLELRDLYERVVARVADSAPYVAVITMYRLSRPWEALRLPCFVSRQQGDTLISATDMGLVGELLLGEMDSYLSTICSAKHPLFDPDDLSTAIAGFAELSMGLVKEVEVRRHGKWGQRLVKARATAAESLQGLLERSSREILGALPTHRASFSGGPRVPDLARPASDEKRQRALRYADLIVGCRPFAAAVSVSAALDAAQEETEREMRTYNEELLRVMREASPDTVTPAEDSLEFAAQLTARILGANEAEYLRRRGRAALSSAAA
ncbi:MAG: hypothetical protein KGO02_23780 [Alphaproteobacteria bacterium]|nr:hypothetical protein [Alphaproteobacteria bacterium]